jgi:hypothetical protein
LGDRVKRNSENFKKMGRSMTIAGTAIVATLGLLVKKASDAQETQAKFGTVFQDVTADASKALKVLRKDYGLSRLAAQDMLSATGDLLTGLGMQGAAALSLSERTQQLAVDLASFTNFSGGAKGASDALTKAMLGERESVKSLGIVITEEMVKERLLAEGKAKLTGQARLQAKAEATLAIAVEQSKNAIGDYQRTKGDLANMTRTLMGRLEDLWVMLGSKLVPVVTKIVGKLQEVVSNISDWVEANPALTSRLVKFVAIAGSLMLILGPMAIVLPKIVAGITAMKAAAVLMTGPFGLAAVVIGTLALGIATLAKNLKEAKKAMSDMVVEANIFADGAKNFVKLWTIARAEGGETFGQFDKLFKRFKGNWEKILGAIIRDPKFASLKGLLLDIASGVKTIDKEGKELSITLPNSFLKIGESGEKAGKKVSIGWGWILKAVHEASVAAGKLQEAGRKMGGILPGTAIEMPKFVLGTEEFETFAEFQKAWLAELQEKWQASWENTVLIAQEVVGGLSTIFGQLSQNRIMQIDNEFEAQKKAIENSLMSEEEKSRALSALDAKTEKERKKALRSAAKSEKMTSLLIAIVNTAAGITKALSTLNIPLAITIGILGGIQAATIAAAPLPSFAEGGDIGTRGGIVGEEGPELFVPRRPGTIIPLKEAARGAGGFVFAPVISPVIQIDAMDSMDIDNFMRNKGIPSIVEALRMNIQLEEFQKALKMR